LKRLFAVLVLVCLFAIPLLAAPRNSVEIVRAEYGSGNNWVDVTDRVRSLVQGNILNFTVSGDALGAESRRGRNRALRLQLKDSNGSTRQLTFRENQLVNLRVSNQYQAGLRVTRATYGSNNRTADVTSILNSQIRSNQLSIQVNNDTMGGDPASGQSKTLTVNYAINGRNAQTTVREGDILRLPEGTVTQSNLQINKATYGSRLRSMDVTSRLNSQVQGDQINLIINNDSMGGDPAPGQAKALTVQYVVNGRTSQVITNEGDTLRLPYNNNASYGDLSQRIRCESLEADGYRRKYCSANTTGGVRLSRTLGGSCSQGSGWGYDNNGVWVDHGCRAEFEIQRDGGFRGGFNSTTIPNGTELSIRTNETIDSKNATEGQTYSALINEDVRDSSGNITIPKGSDAQLVIRSANGGSITSASEVVLDVESIMVNGTRYTVSTGDLEQQGGAGVGANRRTGIMVGGGAAVGTLIGAIVGGGKGAAIGAAVGAGAGLGTEVLTKGKQVRVPAETLLSFKLDQDLRLQASR
jgi:hypothetical protein